MKVIILAAGYATRLFPLTKDKPKALLPIGSKPLLDHLVDKIRPVKLVDKIILVTNDRFYTEFESWAEPHGISVVNDGTTSNEDRLGAIGDLQFALEKHHVKDDILVLASDNLFEGDLRPFVDYAAQKKDAACIGVTDIKDPLIAAGKYGILHIDEMKRITRIDEKPLEPQTTWVSMGIYYFPASSLPLIREYLGSTSKKDAPGYYATWLLDRIPVYSFLFGGKWYDIGSLEQLEEASQNYAR